MENKRVILVVGAGVAAVKLATTLLQKSDNHRVILLDANDYIGGRLRSVKFQGVTIDLGANWV